MPGEFGNSWGNALVWLKGALLWDQQEKKCLRQKGAMVLLFSFDCEKNKWYPWNSDSYWDLYESEIMLTAMRNFSPEQAVKILEEKKAFCQV